MSEYSFGVDWAEGESDFTGLVLAKKLAGGGTEILLSVTGEAAEVLADAMGMWTSGAYRVPGAVSPLSAEKPRAAAAEQEEYIISVDDSSGFERALEKLDRTMWDRTILVGDEFLILKSAKDGRLVVKRRSSPEKPRGCGICGYPLP